MQTRLITVLVALLALVACCKHPARVKVELPTSPMMIWDGFSCGGLHTADCQCWTKDASDCEGEEICHWCPGSLGVMLPTFEWGNSDDVIIGP